MSKYMETAAKASVDANRLYELLPEDNKAEGAILIAKLFNWGVRFSPRGVQSTVRLNAVSRATHDLPITCKLVSVETDYGKTFKALDICGNGDC